MASRMSGQPVGRLMVALALTTVVVCQTARAAQAPPAPAITADGTLGTVVGRAGDAYSINAGTVRGTNLFHSFGRFNVPAGGSVTFTGPDSIANILNRVTGGEQSTIDGLISTRATMPNANFFLINPNGVLFTSGASLDVGGAFRVSTSDNIRLADGTVFSAMPVPGEASLLTSAPPQAFGFLSNAPASITVQGATLVVDPGQMLSLVGGDVQIVGGALIAPSGLVQIGSVASAGNALLNGPNLDLGSFARLGQVSISEGAFVTAGTDFIHPGGTVSIRSGRLVVDNAVVTTDTFDLDGAPLGIELKATESIVLGNNAVVQTQSFGAGAASGISIAARNLQVKDAAVVDSLAFGTGPTGGIDVHVDSVDILNGAIRTSSLGSAAGDIRIAASDTVTLSGPTGEISTGTFALDPNILAGNISVTAENVILGDQARLRSGSLTEQAGKILNVTAHDSVTISGLAGISSQAIVQNAGTVEIAAKHLIMDAGFINTSTLGAGNAGPVLVNASTLSLTNGAQIASSSQIVATGDGGSITVNGPGSVKITGVGPEDGVGSITFTGDPSSGLFSTAQGSGQAGAITINTPLLVMGAGAKASVSTSGAGNAGNIRLNVGSFDLTSNARVDSGTTGAGAGGSITLTAATGATLTGLASGIFSTTQSSGDAGQIAVSTPTLTLGGGAQIAGSSQGAASTGRGGSVTVTAPGSVALAGVGSGLFSTAEGFGDAGRITVTTPTLSLSNGSTISVATAGAGNAGDIGLTARTFSLRGGARVDSSTTGAGQGGTVTVNVAGPATISSGAGLFSTAEGSGPGGDLKLQASDLQLLDRATISANSSGADTAVAGNVNIIAGSQLRLANSSITTQAAVADGGNISITTSGSLVHLTDSQITTSVRSGVGRGGNITIGSRDHPSEFVLLNSSQVRADAFGGPGGNINLNADIFLTSGSLVSASSALSTPGIIDIQASVTDVSGSLVQLPAGTLEAAALLRASCAARLAGGKSSSLVLAGRDGLPLDPAGLLPSPLVVEGPEAATLSLDEGYPWFEELLRVSQLSLDPECSR